MIRSTARSCCSKPIRRNRPNASRQPIPTSGTDWLHDGESDYGLPLPARPLLLPSSCNPNFSIPETVDQMIVHHADRLHVRINDCGTDEAESASLEILAKR